jgi:tRNA modification GTPase
VTEVPGTTRDLVTEVIDLDGLRVTLVDTAGLRSSEDVVEVEGVARSRSAAAVADLVLFVADGSVPWPEEAARDIPSRTLLVSSKCDLSACWSRPESARVSALTGEGLDDLKARMLRALDVDHLNDRPEVTNVRHLALVERARDALTRARAALSETILPEEFVLADLQDARAALEEITGKRTPDDLLAHIFARFCIGK